MAVIPVAAVLRTSSISLDEGLNVDVVTNADAPQEPTDAEPSAQRVGGLRLWGGTRLTRRSTVDQLVLQMSADDTVRLDSFEVFGTTLTVASESTMTVSGGGTATYTLQENIRFDPATMSLVVVGGGGYGLLVIQARFAPPRGEAYPRILMHDGEHSVGHPVRMLTSGFAGPDYAAQRELVGAGALASLRRAHVYNESELRVGPGHYEIHHRDFDGDREDAMATGWLARGYLALYQVTGEDMFAGRAAEALDRLCAIQQTGPHDGAFGFAWAWGSGHASSTHFENGQNHPEGTPLAILTATAGRALVAGYRVLTTTRYLDAAVRSRRYLLENPHNGMMWLDAEHASVPYCTRRRSAQRLNPNRPYIEVYNIDGTTLSLIADLYWATGDRSYFDNGPNQIAANVFRRIRTDGFVPYAWYVPNTIKSADYAEITYQGLLDFSWVSTRPARECERWRARARFGFSWRANYTDTNLGPPGTVHADTSQDFGLGPVDDTNDVVRAIERELPRQDGAGKYYTGEGNNTRNHARLFANIGNLLVEMGHHS